MAQFTFGGQKTNADSVQSVVAVIAAASNPRRAELYEFTLGNNQTPVDTSQLWVGQRSTSAGTGASLTPNARDPADVVAATTLAKDTVTADPTPTANAFCFKKALNNKATFRWAQMPGRGIIIPATASAGIILGLAVASAALSFTVDGAFDEH